MPSVALGTGAGASGVLLERSAQLSTLIGCLEAVQRSSRGQVLLVGGEAGVGKTTLLRRFCEERGRSVRVLWGACDPLFTPSPLGPLRIVAEETGGELEEVVARGAMPHAVVTALAGELSAPAATVLVLEDAHWADEATLDVFRLLARRVETVPALVVVTYRDDELDRAHPFRILIGELATSRTVGRVKLARLSPAAVAQLAEPYGVDADELYRKTAGNPFFVVEALASGAEGIPDTVRDAVLARAARLSPAAAELLEAVAVVPPRAELWLLEALAGAATDPLDECLASGMLVVEAAGWRSDTSWPGSPSRSRCHRAGRWACIAGRWRRSPTHRSASQTWPGWRTTPRPPATSRRSCASPRRQPPGQRRSAPIVRQPRSTGGLSGSGIGWRSACGRSCWSAAPMPAI